AAVIVEPVMMNIGIVLPDDGYLAGVLELAHRHGALLIFDEVKTGATIAAGGATERFGVTPDLVALAKAIGGGCPAVRWVAARMSWAPSTSTRWSRSGPSMATR